MSGIDNFPTIERPPTSKPLRPRTRFEVWAWSPVQSFQIGLTLGYLGLMYFAVSAFIAGVPAFRITAPEDWSLFWSAALMIASPIAAIGSISRARAFENLERWGAGFVTLTVGSYTAVLMWIAYVIGDADRAPVAAGFFVLTVFFLVRFMWLMSQLLRK